MREPRPKDLKSTLTILLSGVKGRSLLLGIPKSLEAYVYASAHTDLRLLTSCVIRHVERITLATLKQIDKLPAVLKRPKEMQVHFVPSMVYSDVSSDVRCGVADAIMPRSVGRSDAR